MNTADQPVSTREPDIRLPRWVVVAIFLSASMVATFDYSVLQPEGVLSSRIDYHTLILTRVARTPEDYRVLVPYVLDPVIKQAAHWMPYAKAFGRVYAGYYWVGIAAVGLSLFFYLSIWFEESVALAGGLFATAVLPIGLHHHIYAPWSLLEPTMWTTALVLMVRGRTRWLPALIVIATLNRETALFI